MIRSEVFRIRVGNRLDSPVVDTHQEHLLGHHPIARRIRQARGAGIELVVVAVFQYFPQPVW